MSTTHRTHDITVSVSAPADVPRQEVEQLVGTLLQVGQADAQRSVELSDSELADAKIAAGLVMDVQASAPALGASVASRFDDTTPDQAKTPAYFEAYARYEHCEDAPRYAHMEVSEDFIAKVQALRGLCVDQSLSQVRCNYGVTWGPGDVSQEIRLETPELVVTEWSFWFEDQPRHRDYAISTRLANIDEFIAQVRQHAGPEPLIVGRSDLLTNPDDDLGLDDEEPEPA